METLLGESNPFMAAGPRTSMGKSSTSMQSMNWRWMEISPAGKPSMFFDRLQCTAARFVLSSISQLAIRLASTIDSSSRARVGSVVGKFLTSPSKSIVYRGILCTGSMMSSRRPTLPRPEVLAFVRSTNSRKARLLFVIVCSMCFAFSKLLRYSL